MGHNDAVKALDFGSEQLLTQVWAAIDQHAFAPALNQDRGAQPRIARLVRITLAPVVADLGNAGRRPTA
jgi:hypothetical protein